jgi:uncharacterized integral membrane protein
MGVSRGLRFAAAQGSLLGIAVLGMDVTVCLLQGADQVSQQIVAQRIVLMCHCAGFTGLNLLGDHCPTIRVVLMGTDLRKSARDNAICPAVLIVEVFLNLRKGAAEGSVPAIAIPSMGVLLPLLEGADQLFPIIIAHFIMGVKNKIHILLRGAGQRHLPNGALRIARILVGVFLYSTVGAVRFRQRRQDQRIGGAKDHHSRQTAHDFRPPFMVTLCSHNLFHLLGSCSLHKVTSFPYNLAISQLYVSFA